MIEHSLPKISFNVFLVDHDIKKFSDARSNIARV